MGIDKDQLIMYGIDFQTDLHQNKDWNFNIKDNFNFFSDFQTDLHQNKDWNCKLKVFCRSQSRFQTDLHQNKDWNWAGDQGTWLARNFQTDLHQNKDWNSTIAGRLYGKTQSSRLISIKTRIETRRWHGNTRSKLSFFQTDLHQNKDWNPTTTEERTIKTGFQTDLHQNKDYTRQPRQQWQLDNLLTPHNSQLTTSAKLF